LKKCGKYKGYLKIRGAFGALSMEILLFLPLQSTAESLMESLIANFSRQLEEAITIGKNAKLAPGQAEIRNVLICGLGGSGIGGTIVSELVIPARDISYLLM
jgi:glucose-6-phosphate isomerase